MSQDIEQPADLDPLRRERPDQYQPEAKLRTSDSVEVVNATANYRKSRKLAEASGVDPEMLKMVKEI